MMTCDFIVKAIERANFNRISVKFKRDCFDEFDAAEYAFIFIKKYELECYCEVYYVKVFESADSKNVLLHIDKYNENI